MSDLPKGAESAVMGSRVRFASIVSIGTAINYITHTEAAYVVEASGHERALLVWPFYPQDVERDLRQLS